MIVAALAALAVALYAAFEAGRLVGARELLKTYEDATRKKRMH